MPSKSTFEITWFGGGTLADPMPIIGIDEIKRDDLTDAIVAAMNMLKGNKGYYAPRAHGFYVKVKR
jgi:hypothetical protein